MLAFLIFAQNSRFLTKIEVFTLRRYWMLVGNRINKVLSNVQVSNNTFFWSANRTPYHYRPVRPVLATIESAAIDFQRIAVFNMDSDNIREEHCLAGFRRRYRQFYLIQIFQFLLCEYFYIPAF
jgi:hypothetical protein